MHDEALGFSWHAHTGWCKSKARAGRGQIRFRASHPFCSCGSFARMMPQLAPFYLHIPSLQTRELPSAFRTLAGVLCAALSQHSQVSFDSLRSILSQGGLKMICRSRHSFWQLGRPKFPREIGALHSTPTPFSPPTKPVTKQAASHYH